MDELELELLEKLADCWNMFLSLEELHPDHQNDFKNKVHDLQYMLMSRAAYRTNKDVFKKK
jgi:hypothetical protein